MGSEMCIRDRSSNEFDAFSSPNFPALAESGVKVTVANELLWKSKGPLLFQKKLAQEVGVVTLYPGLIYDQLPVLKHWKVLLLRTFGAGNAPRSNQFLKFLQEVEKNGTIIVNTSQCVSGSVVPGLYDSSSTLEQVKMLSANDMTFESALVKAMVLLGQELSEEEFRSKFTTSLSGELTD